ncbi:hypothetical protein [Spirosoma endophyticum]|uniref:Uncharacterized protein n=1 Tax=Spirosoma endophyticum TaxID=662367 RepID=A0A1I1ZCQ0_9BACT|nr:hypothetical protein [Spirosoma endophyticum]SFE29489.1 hypothetical protein SAMN05216167_11282 [Spirosoma endophyticum]
MKIETTATEYVIRLNRAAFTTEDIERLLRNLRLQELASQLGGNPEEADQLADELMQQWWNGNPSNA